MSVGVAVDEEEAGRIAEELGALADQLEETRFDLPHLASGSPAVAGRVH